MSRQKILESALSAFSRRGYGETTLREIAADVGIKPPSIYAHFESKEALFAAVYEWVSREHVGYFRDLTAAVADLAPVERLRRILAGVEEYYRDRPDLVNFYLRAATADPESVDADVRGTFLAVEDNLVFAIRGAYVEGCEQGDFARRDPEQFTVFYLCLMDGLFLQLKYYTRDEYLHRFALTWRQLSEMLAPQPEWKP